jgi:hypothetical protein
MLRAANAIGFAAPSLPSPLPLASVIDLGPLRALAPDAAIPEIESALLAVRESLPADVDAMTVASLRASLRREFPKLPVQMIDAALAPKPRTRHKEPTDRRRAAGSEVRLREDEPWPDLVDLEKLLEPDVE